MTKKAVYPLYAGTVTKYVFIDSPDVNPQTLAIRAYELSEGLMIKETCFGLQVTGKPDEVKEFIRELRKVDPAHIFVKDRGFPPGDPRRCRANLGGARPGYYGHEFESRILRYISRGLEETASRTVSVEKFEKRKMDEGKLPVNRLLEIIEKEEK